MANDSRQKSEFRVGVGASSILMVLVVLALTALALLSYSGARSAEALAKRNVEMVTAYYNATAEAQQQLSILDETLSSQIGIFDAAAASMFSDQMQENGLADFMLQTDGTGQVFSFSVDAGHDRTIQLAGRILIDGNLRYQLTRHELVSHQMDDGVQYLNLIGE